MVGFHDLVGVGIAPVSKKNLLLLALHIIKSDNEIGK
jgi:hypothetical protein